MQLNSPGMATYSSILAWKIHGQRSLEGYSPWGCKESDITEPVSLTNSPLKVCFHSVLNNINLRPDESYSKR